jgi:hypothetical protein
MWRGLAASLILAGCAQGNFHYNADNLRVDLDPVRFKQFEIDRAVCDGRAAKALLDAKLSGLAGAEAINLVFKGCMAEYGYIIRR